MSMYRDKREKLELFVKEQIVGPGAFNKKYFLLNNWNENEFFSKDISEVNGIDNFSEIITETPAYQYSSAILFPVTKISSDNAISELEDKIEDEVLGEDSDTSNHDEEKLPDDKSESLISKQQNYPNTFGLSFVVKPDVNLSKDIDVNLNYRKYESLTKDKTSKVELGIWIGYNKLSIEESVNRYFSSVLKTVNKDSNLFITLSINHKIFIDKAYDISYIMLNNFVKEEIVSVLKEQFKVDLIKSTDTIEYYGINEIQLYSISSKKYKEQSYGNVITLFNEPLTNILFDNELNEDIELLMSKYEVYKQLEEMLNGFKSIYKESGKSSIWKSSLHSIKLQLKHIDDYNSIFRSKPEKLESEEGLAFSYQYFKEKKTENIFVKILVTNNNEIVGEEIPSFLNKNDEANQKSFFGVEILVKEKKFDVLTQYNTPNLLVFDEEDSFNKLLYRQYKDYGEGYNASVDWGNIKGEKLKFVSTTFLPEEETPKVDFKPSKIEGGNIVSLLEDDTVLSMRGLSSLSRKTDKEIMSNLYEFVETYNSWINERKEELKNNVERRYLKSGSIEEKLLLKQLRSTTKDYNRLKRNIKLLEKHTNAMASFRIMNTAMFMQLHHSIKVKSDKIFSPTENTEEFYRNIDLTKEDDYKWRSFQLAFILLNIDAFIKPDDGDNTVEDVFGTGWPERNDIADLVWFPTGGGKTEAYLGIIAFVIANRRFTNNERGFGTTILMRYTLRLLTLQQFQRASLLIFALEVIRKDGFKTPNNYSLGNERISIGLFVGNGSLPNNWDSPKRDDGLKQIIEKIQKQVKKGEKIVTKLPYTECPWCGTELFDNHKLANIHPNPVARTEGKYGINDKFKIVCTNKKCSFHGRHASESNSYPVRLFDDDIYKYPPTLLFGTVDKFASLANNISTETSVRNRDSRRLFGKGINIDTLPPELIIQDELHLLLGPLGSAVGLFEKSIDKLCTYHNGNTIIKPKIVTSTATTRNTDKQIFALFNRRSEIFPKQGINCDDSFFAYYKRDNENNYIADRKYMGLLPIGKTQVWLQLRIASIALVHRVKYLVDKGYSYSQLIEFSKQEKNELISVLDYYHTVLAYFNSLKEVGKTESQLNHYLPSDVELVRQNVLPWSILNILIRRKNDAINYSELTGRLAGDEVKTNLASIESKWSIWDSTENSLKSIDKSKTPPEFIISTNMISVGIDVSRFNTMIINSMPRNIAEYIQASSRIARDKEGIVFTIHHPFRTRDISHFQKFKEFHEKFYSYVEPISVTPFASKAIDRYLAMFLSVLIRHNDKLGLMNNDDATNIDESKIEIIRNEVKSEIQSILNNSISLNKYLSERKDGIKASVEGIISEYEFDNVISKVDELLNLWLNKLMSSEPNIDLSFRKRDGVHENKKESLFIMNNSNSQEHWKVGYSLRDIAPSTVIKTVQQ